MAKIITVYTAGDHELIDMSYIRWYKISEALARMGHQVDIATSKSASRSPLTIGHNVRKVPLSEIGWNDYDVVKTSYGEGFQTLEDYGGIDHPFIISRLGTVVGTNDMEEIFFRGKRRQQRYLYQQKMIKTSKYIALLNEPAMELWEQCHGSRDNLLIVPGAVDKHIPEPLQDPYPESINNIRCVFAGNLFKKSFAPEANEALVGKLNKLGKILLDRGVSLYVIGAGDVDELDARYVTYLGVIQYANTWNYLYFAHVGIELVKGHSFMHNNESSKIYHYLRAGLPVVSEEGLPNSKLIIEANLGFLSENGNLDLMAERIVEAANINWDRDYAINYVLNNHTWDKRAEVYDMIIKESLI